MLTNGHVRQAAFRWLRLAFSQFVRTDSDKGHLEVERKFQLTAEEAAALPARLAELEFIFTGTARMVDTFLPAAVNGEMLRVRRERIGDDPRKVILTYKQWVDTSTGRERKETEREVQGTVAAFWLVLGRLIAGERLSGFSKTRQLYSGSLGQAETVVCIDDVEGLGKFSGWYLEAEVIVPLNEDPSPYRAKIFELVAKVLRDDREDVKQSYMDMLSASRS